MTEMVNIIGTKGLDAYVVPLSETGKLRSMLEYWKARKLIYQVEGNMTGVFMSSNVIETIYFNEDIEDWKDEIEAGIEILKEKNE